MNPFAAVFAAAALVPAMAAPQPRAADGGSITVTLCEGGSMVIPLGRAPVQEGSTPCCAKGCHSDQKRKRFDSKQ